MLENDRKISDATKRHDAQLNLFDINKELAEKCDRADFSKVSDHLTRWLPKGLLKQKLSGIQVTIFFGLNNFEVI